MRRRAVLTAVIIFALGICPRAILAQDDLAGLLQRFSTATDPASKEATLMRITTTHPESGPALLKLARDTNDVDTKWLAIRGLGYLKFTDAAPFLRQSLLSNAHYVRANAARALGEMHDSSAASELIRAIKKEEDGGVIEQTALALQMLGAREAVPVLETKVQNRSVQTLVWLVGAIEILGSKAEVPFFAGFLSRGDLVAESAAHSIGRLTGEDFGFPNCNGDLCPGDSSLGIANAQKWWLAHKQEWKP